MYALSSDVQYFDNNVAEVTYTIKPSASAHGGTYVLPLPPFIVGQLITVGDAHYEGTLYRH